MPKAISEDVRLRLRAALGRARDRFPPKLQERGWQSRFAEEVGVDQGSVSRLFAKGEGGSVELAERVAAFLGEDPASILFGTSSSELPLKRLDNYRACLREAKRRADLEHRDVPDWVWARVGETRTEPPTQMVTPDLVFALAVTISAAISG